MPTITKRYLESIANLKHVTDVAAKLSMETHGRTVDSWRVQYGSYIFTKLCLHALALLQLRPEVGVPRTANELTVWNIPSVAVIARAIMDSYYVFFYLAIDECTEEELEFRHLLWHYHGEKQRLDMLKLIKSTNPCIVQLKKDVDILKARLVESSFYKSLDANLQRKIRKGERGVLLSNTQLSKRAGIDPNYYKATFNYLSQYVHTYPFAATQLAIFRADDEESLQVAKSVIDSSTGFLSHAIRDFIRLVPDQASSIDGRTKSLIEQWEYTFTNITTITIS